jgi:hypothetical protein
MRPHTAYNQKKLRYYLHCFCPTSHKLSLQVDTAALDDSQYITVRCQHCKMHYSLSEIKAHMATHSIVPKQAVSVGN